MEGPLVYLRVGAPARKVNTLLATRRKKRNKEKYSKKEKEEEKKIEGERESNKEEEKKEEVKKIERLWTGLLSWLPGARRRGLPRVLLNAKTTDEVFLQVSCLFGDVAMAAL